MKLAPKSSDRLPLDATQLKNRRFISRGLVALALSAPLTSGCVQSANPASQAEVINIVPQDPSTDTKDYDSSPKAPQICTLDTSDESIGQLSFECLVELLEAFKGDDYIRDKGIYFYDIRLKVVKELRKRGEKRAIPSLEKVFHSRNEEIRILQESFEALVELRDEDPSELLLNIIMNHHPRSHFLKQIAIKQFARIHGADTLPRFLALLHSSEESDRARAAEALGYLKNSGAVSDLSSVLLNDSSPYVRGCAAGALDWINDKSTKSALKHAILNDRDASVRSASMYALDDLCDAGDVPFLMQVLQNDKSPDIRSKVTRLLGNLGDAKAVSVLIQILKTDPDEFTKNHATFALGKLGDKRAVPALIQVLYKTKPGDSMRLGAIEALGTLGDTRAIPHLLKILINSVYDEDMPITQWALNEIGDKDSILLNIPKYIRRDMSIYSCYNIVELLSDMGDKRAVPYLSLIADSHPDESCRSNARFARDSLLL